MMADVKDWQELTRLTQGAPLVVERVRLADRDIVLEGQFALPQLARLSAEDQVFVAAFLKGHGSIKEMGHDQFLRLDSGQPSHRGNA